MKTKLLLLLGLSLCCVGEQTAMAQAAPGAPPNANPDRLRAIVQSEARKADTKAVEFGMLAHDREILTMALGESMTTVPATTEMHYRIGGIAETFMSTLLLMLVEQGRISLDDKISRWFPNLLAADQVTVRMLVANTAGYIDYVTVIPLLPAYPASRQQLLKRADSSKLRRQILRDVTFNTLELSRFGSLEPDNFDTSVSSHLGGKTFPYERVGLFEPGVRELVCDFATSVEAHND